MNRSAKVEPLAGKQVVSLAQQFPGPFATMLLADLGADVVIVEAPERGDPARTEPAFWEALNRGKRALAVDLKSARGREALLRVIEGTDVLLEGFRPGVVQRLGVDYDVVRARRPSITYVSISGFGQDGRDSHRPNHDILFLALSGMLEPFVRHGVPQLAQDLSLEVADLFAGVFAVIASLVGLSSMPPGGYFDVSMSDSLTYMLSGRLGPALNGVPPRYVNPDAAYRLFETSDDRWLALGVAGYEDHFWRRLCESVGLPELAGCTSEDRAERSVDLQRQLASVIRGRSLDAWIRILGAADVPHAPVLTSTEAVDSHQLGDRGMIALGSAGLRYVESPFRRKVPRTEELSPAPLLGQDTRKLLQAAGLSAADIEDLIASGAASEP